MKDSILQIRKPIVLKSLKPGEIFYPGSIDIKNCCRNRNTISATIYSVLFKLIRLLFKCLLRIPSNLGFDKAALIDNFSIHSRLIIQSRKIF